MIFRTWGGRSAAASLRRHYPGQVQTVGGPSPPSQPLGGAPVTPPMVLRDTARPMDGPSRTRAERAELLRRARLYFVCDGRPRGGDPEALLEAALRGGVDMIQL